jgi:hypothetical protein
LFAPLVVAGCFKSPNEVTVERNFDDATVLMLPQALCGALIQNIGALTAPHPTAPMKKRVEPAAKPVAGRAQPGAAAPAGVPRPLAPAQH